ncbi:Leucine-rich repeat-containing protein 58 [Chamberlinius hualienensis]
MENDKDDFRGTVHNFSYLNLGQDMMEEQLDALFFNTNDNQQSPAVDTLILCHNRLTCIPQRLMHFERLRCVDISNNQINYIDDSLVNLNQSLTSVLAKNNELYDDCLPKNFGIMQNIIELNLSGNHLRNVPHQIFELTNLRFLYLGGNQISQLPPSICRLQRLQFLYLGGNSLTEVPAEVGRLQNLEALILCENQLESLPSSIAHLTKLRTLALHKNHLTTLPPEIVTLRSLDELSLRDNPLVVRFVKDMMYDPPSLLELAARCIKVKSITFTKEDLPNNLDQYLNTARRCVNPKCKGVYFDVCVQHIRFVDFCGKYRIPLLQYLCSPKCETSPAVYNSDTDYSEDDMDIPVSKMKKVLLG